MWERCFKNQPPHPDENAVLKGKNAVLNATVAGLERELDQFKTNIGVWHERLNSREDSYLSQIYKLAEQNAVLQEQNIQLNEQLGMYKARVANLQAQMFGPTTEKSKHKNNAVAARTVRRHKRGKQPKAKGFGRTVRNNLPPKKVFHDLPLPERSLCTTLAS